MKSSLVMLRALSLAARQERKNHQQEVLLSLEEDVATLSSLIIGLDQEVKKKYEPVLELINERIQKKKEEITS